jgi:hypothetical protein
MHPLRPLLHFIHKRKSKQIQRNEWVEKVALEKTLRAKYKCDFSAEGKIKVFIYQDGFEFHFIRFYQSTINKEFNFYLVDDIRHAEVVVFINTIIPHVISENQKIFLFFHEPKTYSHLYQSIIPKDFLGQRNITVVSHIEPSQFITGDFFELPGARITHIKGIPHVHFHHMATEIELMGISEEKKKSICSVVSGFNGVPGYEDRRIFLEKLSAMVPEFDLYGRYGKTIRNFPSYRGYSATKFQTIAEYKYNLVIENSNEEWYISEKIFDTLMCGCMPIYFGTSKIFDLIPPDWFYFLPDLSEGSIKKVIELIHTDQYKVVSQNRAAIARQIDNSFSFYKKLDNLLLYKT